METLKQEAIRVISQLPDTANIEDIMYELYVIDKVKKGREAAERGDKPLNCSSPGIADHGFLE
ncbi:MAG: hypothetical protein IT393_00660 [Nitrospirae bacterium]|nr:hypothetical protein [Nitrospirota bacterium]